MVSISEKNETESFVALGNLKKRNQIVTVESLRGSRPEVNHNMVVISVYLEGTYPGWLE